MPCSAATVITAWVGNVTVRPKYASFGMGVKYFKDGPIHWLNCVAFRPDLIKVVREYVSKGRFLQVFAHPEVRVWDQDGERRTREVHVCDQIVLLPRETYSQETPPQPSEPMESDLGGPILDEQDAPLDQDATAP